MRRLRRLPARVAPAEAELVASFDERQVVRPLIRIGPEDAGRRGRGRDVETAGDGDDGLVVAIAVEVLHAEIDGVEERRLTAVDRRAVERDAHRVDEVRAEHRRHAACCRLRQVVDAARARQRQDVARLGVRRRRFIEGRHVAAEERMRLAELVVDASNPLAHGAIRGLAVGHLSTFLIVRLRQIRHELEGRGAEERRTHLVVDIRRAKCDRRAAVALGGREVPEVAAQHRVGRHERDVARGDLMLVRPLIRAEEEQLVVHDRAAGRAAPLVARQPIINLLAVDDSRKRVDRVEPMVAIEFEEVA